MRLRAGLGVFLILVALSHAAFAVCVSRGLSRTCIDMSEDSAPAPAPANAGTQQSPVAQQSTPTGNAWIEVPASAAGATVVTKPGTDGTNAFTCVPGSPC